MLEEYQGINLFSYKLKKYIYILLILTDLLFAILFVISSFAPVSIIIALIGVNSMFGIITLTINFLPQYNNDFREIKKIGQKIKANIIDTGFTCHGRENYQYFYITVLYNEIKINVYRMKENKEYKILRVLLDSQYYPVMKQVKIPVDIYVYKDKIYVDIESVDLTKMSGYEEAQKTVESIYNEE